MENPEEILHSLEEFTKSKPKDIPRDLEDYLCFVAKTGDPVYQWTSIKCLFREKLISVVTDFYESCPSMEIPPCPNVDMFNYDVMKNFILEKLDTFAAAPFTLQRISELLTAPRKEYSRIDKYMRALEKNVLVVSTVEPGGRRGTENGDGIVNGIESEHIQETANSNNESKAEELENSIKWPELEANTGDISGDVEVEKLDGGQWSEVTKFKYEETEEVQTASVDTEEEIACTSSQDTTAASVVTCQPEGETSDTYVSIEPVLSNACTSREESTEESPVSVTITAIPAGVQKRRTSIEPISSPQSSEQTDETVRDETSSTEEIDSVDSSSTQVEAPTLELSSSEQTGAGDLASACGDSDHATPDQSAEGQISTCSESVQETKVWYETNNGDAEISSSDRTVEDEEVVQSSGLENEEEKNEDDDWVKVESVNVDEPMEIGEEDAVDKAEGSIEEIVKAEATSDSTL